MTRASVTALVLAALVAAVAGRADADTEPEIVVTRNTVALPSGCTPSGIARLLVRLAQAVTAGDGAAIERLFAIDDPPGRASEPAGMAFRWYSVAEGRAGDQPWRQSDFHDRLELFSYFATRHAQRERWDLVGVEMGPAGSRRPEAIGIGYTIRRTADDLPVSLSEYAHGKGEIDCTAQRLFVWAMGQDDRSRSAVDGRLPPCPLPSGWSPGTPIVACTRGPNAGAFASNLRVTGGARLPGQCRASNVSGMLRSTLSAFNAGLGGSFGSHFVRRARFHSYTSSSAPLVGRAAIARFVSTRYSAGDGWTGTRLRVPRHAQETAVFQLSLSISSLGKPLASSRAAVTVECRSGLIRSWIGPAVASPHSE
jgi:hypothetical protein